jgi:hypothetical protein
MAGARKHMERSHRSKGNQNYSIFQDFQRRAVTVSGEKNQRGAVANLFGRFASFLHRNQGK